MQTKVELFIDSLNQMNGERFVETLGWVFEHSPWVAERAYGSRPFTSFEDLLSKFEETVKQAEPAEQIALLRAHPDLAGKLKMTDASVQEQRGAGLDGLSPEEFDRFARCNEAYKEKFGFPFIMAVRNQNKHTIYAALEKRLDGGREEEHLTALREVFKIVYFRISDMIMDNQVKA